MESQRFEWVDKLKGIAIVLVVLGHAISGSGVFDQDVIPVIWDVVYKVINSFHMPLFFFLSGFLYNRKNDYK